MRFCAFAFSLMLALPSFAQMTDVVVSEPHRVVPVQKTVVDMTEVEVRGVLERPSYGRVVTRKKPGFRNLIELRSSFRAELAKSASSF